MLIKEMRDVLESVGDLPKKKQQECARRVWEFFAEDAVRYYERQMKKHPCFENTYLECVEELEELRKQIHRKAPAI